MVYNISREEIDMKKMLMLDALSKNVESKSEKYNMEDLHDIGMFYIELDAMITFLDKKRAQLKETLIDSRETVDVPEYESKILFIEEKDSTEISVPALYRFLEKNGRVKDFLKVASVADGFLKKTLKDGKILSAKYKKIIGKTKPSLSIKDLNAEELAASES